MLNYIQTQLTENEERLLVKLDNQSTAGNPLSPRELYKILQDSVNNFLNNLQPFERWNKYITLSSSNFNDFN